MAADRPQDEQIRLLALAQNALAPNTTEIGLHVLPLSR